jgi:cytochrome c oxidase subunit 2
MRHFVIVGILVIIMAALTYIGLNAAGLMPVEASVQAVSIDSLWNYELIAMSFLFALIVVPIMYSLIIFRRKKGETGDGEHIEGNTRLEIAWTVIPLFMVIGLAYMGAYSLGEVRRVDPNAMVVKVTASQWAWKFEYPDLGVISKELYLPVNKQVVLKMESLDVIHSFWVPEFRLKQDIVPGRVTEYRVTPSLIGDYKVRCSEICGTSHAFMESPVIVVSQADFDNWIAEQQAFTAANQTPEGKGQALVSANGCAACHSVNGAAGVGPTWQGLFGSTVELEGGSSVIADEAYLTESLKDPKTKVVKGFQPTMPIYPFTDEEIANIVAYIKTLK